jgi:SH3-like domain-containing protein
VATAGGSAQAAGDTEGSAEAELLAPGSRPAAAVVAIGPQAGSPVGAQAGDGSPASLALRSAPSGGAEVIAQVVGRQQAIVFGRDSGGEWLLVQLANGAEGWVGALESGAAVVLSNLPVVDGAADSMSPEPTTPPEPTAVPEPAATPEPATITPPLNDNPPVSGTALVHTGALNLRSGPGMEYAPLAVVFNGQTLLLLDQSAGKGNVWVLVRTADGQQGWVNSLYLVQAN